MAFYFLIAGQALCLFSLWALARADVVRLINPACRVEAVVIGYRSAWEDGSNSYAPVYRFTSDGAEHEVADAVYRPARSPPPGTSVVLSYPQGRPDLARVPRPLMWLAVYGVLVVLEGVLLAKMLGWLGG